MDVGDLDRVIQLGATRSVASMLQRLGRTGRRPGTSRNMLFLGVESEDFLRAAAVLLLWAEGNVEPVVPPAAPVHVWAQQLVGTVLQEGAIGGGELSARGDALRWGPAAEVVNWLETAGFLDRDGDLLFVGEEAERRYGRVHYRDLVAVFIAPPQFVVLHGRSEIGQIDPLMLTRKVDGPRVILLGGRPWLGDSDGSNAHAAMFDQLAPIAARTASRKRVSSLLRPASTSSSPTALWRIRSIPLSSVASRVTKILV